MGDARCDWKSVPRHRCPGADRSVRVTARRRLPATVSLLQRSRPRCILPRISPLADSVPANKAKPKCPTCGKPSDLDAPPAGPFCSERCKMIDLGKWLGEEYRISEPLRPDHFAEFEELGGGTELDRPQPRD